MCNKLYVLNKTLCVNKLVATAFLLFSVYMCKAQIAVTNTNAASILAQKLVGPGVTLSNATIQCNANQSGIFIATSSNLGIDSGIVLTTGYAGTLGVANGVNGPQVNFANANQGTGGDADLTALAGISTFDKCILEFDFKGDGDSVFFQYIFGSEEYPAFNCSNYNDVFGFFISGPGYATPQNIALIPGTTIPVAINSVNSGVISSNGSLPNCTAMGAGSPFVSYYVNNSGGTSVTYDGFTTLFTAKAPIQPCNIYHLKLAIADGFDHIFDSGVFLKAGSLKSNTVVLNVHTDSLTAGVPSIYEQCNTATVNIRRLLFQSTTGADTVHIQISGTATNGVDYPAVVNTFYFTNSLTDTLRTFTITPYNDLILEGIETIKIVLLDKCNDPKDSVTILVKDPPTFHIATNDTLICQGSSVSVLGTYDNGLSYNWQPSSGVSNGSGLNAVLTPNATTTYTLTTVYGTCTPTIDSLKITVEPKPTITTTPTNVLCNGLSTGSILCTAAVGSSPLTFSIIPGTTILNGSPSTFSNLSAGVYTITVTSALGCTNTSLATITEPAALSWSVTNAVNVTCNATNTGQIHTTATGGNGVISYTLNPGNITNTNGNFNTLTIGSFTVTAKDANNCSISTFFTITQAAGLAWTLVSNTTPNCFGQTTASITSLSVGGTGIISYHLMPGNLTNTTGLFTNLGANSYTITASDANSCTGTTIVTITQAAQLINSSTPIVNVLCNGASTGSITMTTSGGTPPINFILNPGGWSSATGIFNNKTAGNYTITATDSKGCTVSTVASITQPAALSISNLAVVNVPCSAGSIGSITITGTGGVAPYSYKLNTGAYQSGNSFTSLASNNYTITIKDANGCTAVSTTSVLLLNAPILTNVTSPLLCNDSIGTLLISANNGTPAYTFTLTPGAVTNTTGTFPNLATGMYTVSVVDAAGCTSIISVPLIPPPGMVWGIFNVSNLPCGGGGTGSLSVLATGGINPITYTLTPPGTINTTGNFSGLNVNSYNILAVDANGCSIASPFNIVVLPAFTINPPTINQPLCYGYFGNVSLSTTGGTGTKTFTINPGGASNTTGTFLNLINGTYTISVTDAGNCSNSTVVTITQPPQLTLAHTITGPSCVPGNNGVISCTASGGASPYLYKLNSGGYTTTTTYSGLVVGVYTVTIKDANNCTLSSVITLNYPNAPSFSSFNITPINCAGNSTGAISTTINGGTGAISFTLLPLNINNFTGVFNSLSPNTYTVTVVDANNCTLSSVATISQASSLLWTSTNKTNVTCHNAANGQIQVAASGGVGTINYNLMPGNINNTTGIYTSLGGSNYTVTATDANGCTLTSVIVVTNPGLLSFSASSVTQIACYGMTTGAINAPAIGGIGTKTFTLNPNGTTDTMGVFTNLTSGSYTVNVVDANGCSVSSTFNLTQPTQLAIASLSNTVPTCVPGNNATITVAASGGSPTYQYNINGGSSQFTTVFTGIGVSTYTVQVSDSHGCTATSSIAVSNPVSPNLNSATSINILCFGGTTGSINVTASGGTGALNYNLQPTNTTNSSGSFNSLLANNYTVSVTDANGCSATSNIILTQPNPLIWDSVNNRDITCFGGSNGLVTSTASGGAGNIVYSLMPGSLSNSIGTFFGLAMGVYTISATDNNGCVVSAVFNINQAPPISWSLTNMSPVSCFGGNNGSIHIAATGGFGSFSYKLLPGAIVNTSGIYSNLTSGIYTIIASDAYACSISTTINVTQAAPIQLVNAITTHASCNPGCDASVTLTASGGNGTYAYSSNGGTTYQLSNTFNALCAGNYTVTIKDGNNCTGTGSYSITTANGPNQIVGVVSDVSCNGGSNGALNYTVSGGGALPITYSLTPNAISNTTGSFTNLSSNNYTVVASDANGCTISTTSTIAQPNTLNFTSAIPTDVTCFGASNGALAFTTTGGTGIVTYTILPTNQLNTTGIFNGLASATYTITAVDAHGCSVSTSVAIGTPTAVSFTNTTISNVSCFGGADGSISTAASGGTGTISYTILPNNITNTTGQFTGLVLTVYTITATDVNGCTSVTTASITQPTSLVITTVSSTIPTCVPGGDASITVTTTGGTAVYSYSVNGGVFQTSNTINNLSIGVYTVTVKDANNCIQTTIASVTSPSSPTITSIAMQNASCNPGCDGLLTVSSTNGIGTHTYSINGGTYQISNSFTSLCSNTYTIVVKDASGCTTSSVATVTTVVGPSLVNTTSTNVLCNNGSNGSITLISSGGTGPITYVLLPNTISNTTGAFTGLGANTYTITGTDMHGCSISTNVTLTQPAALQFSNVTSTPALCFNVANGIIVTPTSGGTPSIIYSITPSGTFITPNSFSGLLGNITYTVFASDANGCSVSTTVFVTQPNAVNINSVSNTAVTCNGLSNGTLTASASGGSGVLTYAIQPSNTSNTTGQFTNLSGATYTVTVTDANGCSKTSTSILFEPGTIVILSSNATDIICNGQTNGTVSVTSSGGIPSLSYTIQPSNTTNATGAFTQLSANTFTITITDANGCTKTTTQTVHEPSVVHFNTATKTDVLCHGQSNATISANASGGVGIVSYTLLPNNTNNTTGNFNGLNIGTYTIIAKDANNCSANTTLTIAQPTPLMLSIDSTKNISCFGGHDGFIVGSALGGTLSYVFTLQPSGINSSSGFYLNESAGIYNLMVTDANGCKDSIQNIVLSQPTPITYNQISHTDITCYLDSSGSITLSTLGGTGIITHTIAPISGTQVSSGNFQGLGGGTYTITSTDANGCTASTLVTIAQHLLLVADITFIEPVCHGDLNGSITIQSSGGVAPILYSLNNGPFTTTGVFNYVGAGTQLIITQDAKGCIADTMVTLTEPDKVNALFDITESKCIDLNDAKLTVSGIGGRSHYTYYLKPGLYFNQNGFFQNLKEGIYTLTVKDSAGCTFDTMLTINPPIDPLRITITKQDLGCHGIGNEGWAQANPQGGEGPYAFQWTSNPIQTTQRAEELTTGYYTVVVSDANGCSVAEPVYIEPGPCCEEVILPNAFSPNGDGNNDVWRIITATGFDLIQLEVYDRWGNRVWGTLDAKQGWDGTFKGKAMDIETYYYIFRYICLADHQKYMKKGDIILVR